MAKSHFSTVLDHPAEEVWAVIRHFAYEGFAKWLPALRRFMAA